MCYRSLTCEAASEFQECRGNEIAKEKHEIDGYAYYKVGGWVVLVGGWVGCLLACLLEFR